MKPNNCSGGTIRVRGKNTTCTNGPFYSSWSTVKTVTRQIGNPGSITGPDLLVCLDTDPIHFSVAAVTGATSYEWQFPSGWSGSSTTNSITLTPNGTSGGNVSIRAKGCNIQSSTASVKMISLELYDPELPPTINGPSIVCTSNSTFTLQDIPSNSTVTWSKSSNLTYVSGQGTSNYTVKAASSSASGEGLITATVSTECGDFDVSKTIQVGTSLPIISPPAEISPCCTYVSNPTANKTYQFDAITSNPSTNITDYQWQIIPPPGSSSFPFLMAGKSIRWGAPEPGSYTFKLRHAWECGWSNWVTKQIYFRESNTYSVFPNPTSDILVVQQNDHKVYLITITLRLNNC